MAAAGINDCEISRLTGVPRSTVRDIRSPRHVSICPRCPRCWRPGKQLSFTAPDYAELLGLYLGDGCITAVGRIFRLRLSLDAKYPTVVREARDLLCRSFPDASVGGHRQDRGSSVVLSVYSLHLPCLLPQHGPGKKHHRRITLEPWQQSLVEAEPRCFLRGCIRSDGCNFINRTGPYSYLSYDFRNLSSDIIGLFAEACDLAGVEYRRYATNVRINRRASVALMEAHVGIKS